MDAGRVSFFKGMTTGRLTRLQGMDPHPKVHGQQKLDSIDLRKKEDIKLGGEEGRGGSGSGGRDVKILKTQCMKFSKRYIQW